MNIWYVGFKRRMLYTLIASFAFISVYYVGSVSNLSEDDAAMLKERFSDLVKNIDSNGIFLNNFKIAILMFIPVIGIGLGLFSAYMTGITFKAFALTSPELASIPSLILLLTPFGIMELFSYSLAISQSMILFKSILTKRMDKQLIYSTLIQVAIVAVILFAAAIIEYYMIKTIGKDVIV